MNRAKAGKVRIRLRTSESLANSLQQRCSALFHARLQHELTRVLTHVAVANDDDCVIERLTVSVGDIPLSGFETVMSERVIRALSQALQTCRWHRGEDGVLRGTATGENPTMTSASVSSQKAIMAGPPPGIAAASRRFSQLLHYLDTGIVNDARPWSSREGREAWLAEILNKTPALMPGQQQSTRVALALRVLVPHSWQRLVTTWTGPMLTPVCTWLISPLRLPLTPAAQTGHVLPLAAMMALQAHPLAAKEAQTLQEAIGRTGGVSAGSRMIGHRVLLADSAPLNRWLATLLQAPMSPLLQTILAGWLGERLEGLPHVQTMLQGWWRDHPQDLPHLQTALSQLTQLSQVNPVSQINPVSPRRPVMRPPSGPRKPQQTRDVASLPDAEHRERHILARSPGKEKLKTREVAPDETQWVSSAGLVLLWPLLPQLFELAGWTVEGQFVDDAARWQAVAALDWLAWADEDLAEWRAPVARLLCGIDPETPFNTGPVEPEQQDMLDSWLDAILRAVPSLQRCGTAMVRSLFLQRAGILSVVGSQKLALEREAADILLLDLPWPLSQVVLPWREVPLGVEWKV